MSYCINHIYIYIYIYIKSNRMFIKIPLWTLLGLKWACFYPPPLLSHVFCVLHVPYSRICPCWICPRWFIKQNTALARQPPANQTFRVSISFLCRFPFSRSVVLLWGSVDLGPAVLPVVSPPKFFSQTGLRGGILAGRVFLEEKCSRSTLVM